MGANFEAIWPKSKMLLRSKRTVLQAAAVLVAVAGLFLGPVMTPRCCQAVPFDLDGKARLLQSQPCCEQKAIVPQAVGFCPFCCEKTETSSENATPFDAPCRCKLQPREPVSPLLLSAALTFDVAGSSAVGILPKPETQITGWQPHFSNPAGTLQRPARILYGVWRN